MTISFYTKIKNQIVGFLKQGTSPEKLAMAISLGICIGIIPLLGSTSILCMILAFSFRLNMASIQTVNYLTYPLQLLLYIPFLKAGATIGNQSFDYSLSEILTLLKEETWTTIQRFFIVNVYALGLWFMIAVFLYFILYILFLKSFQKIEKAIHANTSLKE